MHLKIASLYSTQIWTDPTPHAVEAMVLYIVALFYLCGIAIIVCAVVQKFGQPGPVCRVRRVDAGDPNAVY